MNAKDFIEILVGISALVSFTYKISQLETKIYRTIDSTKDILLDRIIQQENKFAIHLSNYFARNEMQDYLIHALDEKIDHKFSRCWTEIKEKDD